MTYRRACSTKIEKNLENCPNCGAPVLDEPSLAPVESNVAGKTVKRAGESTYGVIHLEDLPPGHIIDERYEIEEKLGQGGFGTVYRAFDRSMDVDKALKVLSEAMASDREAMLDLRSEAKAMVMLNHPNIVRVYDFHEAGAIKYIDMEYVAGKTLTDIKLEYPDKRVPEKKVRELALQMASGLAYAHDQGVIHKDIKPQNIMVTAGGQVKIMDFGIAEKVRMSRVAQSSSSGTLVYMSPEQLRGKDVGKEADIYLFGAVLYDLLSGHPPFYKGDIQYQILNEQSEEIKGISLSMNELLQNYLDKEYKERYNIFEEVIQCLRDLSSTAQADISQVVKPDQAESSQSHLIRTFNDGHSDVVSSVAISPDGRYALSGSHDKTIKLWEVSSWRLIRTFEGHRGSVISVAFSSDGQQILSGSSDNTLKLWDIAVGTEVRTFKELSHHINSVAFSPDGCYVLSGDWDNALKLWDLSPWTKSGQ